jgi:hypothetical protein
MEQVHAIWNWLVEQYTTNPIAAPIVTYLLGALAGKLGNVGLVILEVRRSMADGTIKDVEMATIGWRIISVFYGWTLFPTESKKFILKYAPEHQQKIILGEK